MTQKSFTFLMVMAVMYACGDYKRGIPVKTPPPDDSYQNMVIEETFKECTSGDEDCSYARAVFPQFITPDADFLNPLIVGALADQELAWTENPLPPDSVTARFKDFIGQFATFKEDFPEDRQVWFKEITVVPNRPFQGWISLEFQKIEFEGGAHESKITRIENFDLSAKKAVPLQAVMKPGFEEELANKLEATFRKDNKLSPSDSLKKAGLFEETWKLPKNYQLTTAGIRFYYNPYEIAPWSSGAIEITLPWAELQTISVLKPIQ